MSELGEQCTECPHPRDDGTEEKHHECAGRCHQAEQRIDGAKVKGADAHIAEGREASATRTVAQ